MNFQVVLLAVDSGTEDSEFNSELASQFAREKQLPFIACEVGDRVKVQQVFQTLVERIMESLESDNVTGWSLFYSSVHCLTHTHTEQSVKLHDYGGSSSRQSGCLC